MPQISGTIPYFSTAACQCQGVACDSVEFAGQGITVPEGITGISGRATDIVATAESGGLRFRQGRRGLTWEVTDDAPDTPALDAIIGNAEAGAAIYGRPLIDNDNSVFQDVGRTRRYTRARMRALLIKPILDPNDRQGWTPAEVERVAALGGERMERRFIEFRADGRVIEGPLMVYGDEAQFGDWRERFEPRSLQVRDDVIVNLQHDRRRPVARTGAGLRIDATDREVRADIRLPETVFGREAHELVQANILRGFSVEFRARQDRWEGKTRIIERADLLGFALVDRPAYPAAQIADRMAALHEAVARPTKAVRRIWQ